MPKATLSYDLPEDQTDFDMATHALDMWMILNDLDQELRDHFKWESHPEWDDKTVEEIRRILIDAMAERGVNFN
tara:strand:- start:356 stop:577 length:222 start_codon:yes stop_codon:yes gene_type:complete